jgi:uncharacterized protein YndB with AHSA1/START domain
MGLHWAEHSVEIAASPQECFDAIVDYETFPQWQNAVEATEVLERNRKKLGELVRFEVDGKVRKVGYVLRYHYDAPDRITWDFVEGHGISNVEGAYTFEDTGRGTTIATYRLGVDPGRGIPGPVAKRMNKQVMKRSVEDLKDEVERRAEAGGEEKTSVLGALRRDKKEPQKDEDLYIEEETGYYRQVKPGEFSEEDPGVVRGAPPTPSWGSGPLDAIAKPLIGVVGKAAGAAGGVAGRIGRLIPGRGKDRDQTPS